MTENAMFNKIIKALLTDYSSIYYVDARTGGYTWFSGNPEFNSLNIERNGEDFFANMKRDAEQVVYPEDLHIFTRDLQKENLMAAMKDETIQHVEYRLVIDRKPVWHALRIIKGLSGSDDDDYFILGVKNIDKQVKARISAEKTRRDKEILNHIAESLAEDYETIYYIDVNTGAYSDFSPNESYTAMNIEENWTDFFSDTLKNAEKLVHPDDRDFAMSLYSRDALLQKLEGRNSFSYRYRVMVNGEYRYFAFYVLRTMDDTHLVLCVKDVSTEMTAETQRIRNQKVSITYSQIAESLAAKYDVIYYVNTEDGRYAGFVLNPIYGKLEMQEEGNDFFTEADRNMKRIVHHRDRERVRTALQKDSLISALSHRKQFSMDYRLVIDGEIKYTRLSATRSSDREHFIIGVENIDDEVQKEKEFQKALNSEKELARRDGLTGVKNKTAFSELEHSIQNNINSGLDYLPFALVVCDINGLKEINDTEGHVTGDEYIKASSQLISDSFKNSPVFRIGGDEFVVFVRGDDFTKRYNLLEKFKKVVAGNIGKKGAPVIASGMAEFVPGKDHTMSEIFQRADTQMYADKRRLKE